MNVDHLLSGLSGGKKSPVKLGEDIFILVCIFTIWPKILGWRGVVFDVLLYTALVGLVIIFVRRIKRIRAESEQNERSAGNPRTSL